MKREGNEERGEGEETVETESKMESKEKKKMWRGGKEMQGEMKRREKRKG